VTRARIHKLLNAYIEAQIAYERADHIANFSEVLPHERVLLRQKAEAARAAKNPAMAEVTSAVQQLAIEKLRAWQATWDRKPAAKGATS
jgi:hypothetical protein